MKRTALVHATAIVLGGAARAFNASRRAGILILGPSGSGKSDLALRLIAAGASLVADDQSEVFAKRGRVHVRAPRRIAGLMEVRGLGIIDLPYTEEAPIAVVVRLVRRVTRLPHPGRWTPPGELAIAPERFPPLLDVVAKEASAPAKIAAAAAAFAGGAFREKVKRD